MKLSIGLNLLDRVHCAKFLGFFIDERMDWHEQIQLCKSKITSGIYIMNDVKHLKTIYHTLIRPYLYHGNLLWGSAYKRYTKLLVLQKKLSNYFHQSLKKLDYILQSFLYHDSKLWLELPQYVKEAKSVSSSNYHYESCLNFACHLLTILHGMYNLIYAITINIRQITIVRHRSSLTFVLYHKYCGC